LSNLNAKPEQILQAAIENLKKQRTLGKPQGAENVNGSTLNIDKFLLDSQDTYKSPALLDEVPDYIRQLSSTAVVKDN
jgi:hypothetical protein